MAKDERSLSATIAIWLGAMMGIDVLGRRLTRCFREVSVKAVLVQLKVAKVSISKLVDANDGGRDPPVVFIV